MGVMRYGVHRSLEDEADRLIRESLKGVTKHSDKADILTAWKQGERYRREVYSSSGTPDPSVRLGMYHRAANTARPELNSREGIARARMVEDSLSTFVKEHGNYGDFSDR